MTVLTPRILNMRAYGNQCPEWAFRMDRATKYGNQFRIGDNGMTREDVCLYHNEWLTCTNEGIALLNQFLTEYDGRPMACWCTPKRCHCDNYARAYVRSSN